MYTLFSAFSKFWMIDIQNLDTSEVHKYLNKITNYLSHKIAVLNRELTKKRKRCTRKDKDKQDKKPQKGKTSEDFIQESDSNDDTNGTNKTNAMEYEVDLDNLDPLETRKYEDGKDKGNEVNDSESMEKEKVDTYDRRL